MFFYGANYKINHFSWREELRDAAFPVLVEV
jgi:hypothetical protein